MIKDISVRYEAKMAATVNRRIKMYRLDMLKNLTDTFSLCSQAMCRCIGSHFLIRSNQFLFVPSSINCEFLLFFLLENAKQWLGVVFPLFRHQIDSCKFADRFLGNFCCSRPQTSSKQEGSKWNEALYVATASKSILIVNKQSGNQWQNKKNNKNKRQIVGTEMCTLPHTNTPARTSQTNRTTENAMNKN